MSFGYAVRCKRCGKYFFSRSLRFLRKVIAEHWDTKHWRWDIAPTDYRPVYQGRVKTMTGYKGIYKNSKKESLPSTEYELIELNESTWDALREDGMCEHPKSCLPSFNLSIYVKSP